MRQTTDSAKAEMRRADRLVTERSSIDAIIRRSRVCRLALVWQGEPYLVPLCFGYDGDAVYLHMATAGKKLDALRANLRVCLEWDNPGDLVPSAVACGWGMSYESVIARGVAEFLTEPEAQRNALLCIMAQYAGNDAAWSFPANQLARTVIVRVRLTEITGKVRG